MYRGKESGPKMKDIKMYKERKRIYIKIRFKCKEWKNIADKDLNKLTNASVKPQGFSGEFSCVQGARVRQRAVGLALKKSEYHYPTYLEEYGASYSFSSCISVSLFFLLQTCIIEYFSIFFPQKSFFYHI